MRLLLELVAEVRAVIPSSLPLLVHIPGSDWMVHDSSVPAWNIKQCVELFKALARPAMGVDLPDVTSAGLMAEQKIVSGPAYQAPFSQAVRNAVQRSDTLVGVVGLIRTGDQAEKMLQDGMADVVLASREGIPENPAVVWQWAEQSDVEVRLANLIDWGFGQRTGGGLLGEKPVVQLTARE